MTPVYAGQVIRDGATLHWNSSEKVKVSYEISSPTIKRLAQASSVVELRSDDGKYHDRDSDTWSPLHSAAEFTPDRLGRYTLTYKGEASEMELDQTVHFTLVD